VAFPSSSCPASGSSPLGGRKKISDTDPGGAKSGPLSFVKEREHKPLQPMFLEKETICAVMHIKEQMVCSLGKTVPNKVNRRGVCRVFTKVSSKHLHGRWLENPESIQKREEISCVLLISSPYFPARNLKIAGLEVGRF